MSDWLRTLGAGALFGVCLSAHVLGSACKPVAAPSDADAAPAPTAPDASPSGGCVLFEIKTATGQIELCATQDELADAGGSVDVLLARRRARLLLDGSNP